MAGVDPADLELADVELTSLLRKCEAVLEGTKLSPSRQTLMANRVAALRTALALVADAQRAAGPGRSASSG